jgi:hypothetical protein
MGIPLLRGVKPTLKAKAPHVQKHGVLRCVWSRSLSCEPVALT